MREIFIDGPGQFTSDGSNIKFTLESVQNEPGGFRSVEVVQLTCSLQTAKRLTTFLQEMTKRLDAEVGLLPKSEAELPPRKEGVDETRRLLSTRGAPHT
jgi:hypothetical protein